MSNKVEIKYENIPFLEKKDNKIQLLCNNIFDILNINNWELSIVICDDLFIKLLNKEYRNIDEATDVLSFSQLEDNFPLSCNKNVYAGDIVISLDTLKRNAEEFNVDINEEFIRLILHGILHIRGYTHSDNSSEQKMIMYQEEIMNKLTGVKIF
ncbi:MAG: rRNA maturation RNase YbeY [Spirochaetaceae bacterium]|nr:rRNA maturation RNase YbeY [Spirochaetaceae bacterium]